MKGEEKNQRLKELVFPLVTPSRALKALKYSAWDLLKSVTMFFSLKKKGSHGLGAMLSMSLHQWEVDVKRTLEFYCLGSNPAQVPAVILCGKLTSLGIWNSVALSLLFGLSWLVIMLIH